MLNNVKDFGAVGDGTNDDRPFIQAAIDDAVSNNKGGIMVPSGTYRVSRVGTQDGETPERWSLDLNGVQDFMVMGEGPKSVVKLMDTTKRTGDWHVFILQNNCLRVVFKDLVIDGNRNGLTKPDEQSHGIEVNPGTEDLVVDRCILRECFGDGMRLLGQSQAGPHVKRLRIENSLFQKNKRSGISIQRAIEQIIIANCIFDATASDQSIDFEPTGSGGPTDLLIQGCIINHTNKAQAVTFSGVSGRQPLVRCKFSDNILLGGPIFSTDVNQLTIQNNIIVVTNLGAGQRIPIQVQRGGDSVVISGNLLVNDDTATKSVIRLSEVNQRQVTRALVTNNLCFARAGNGISCLSSDDVAIQGNMIVATDSCAQGIFLRSEGSSMDNISIRDNDVTVKGEGSWKFGIRVAASAPHHIDHFSITGNSIRGAANGIAFDGIGFRQTPVCALNRIADDVASPLVDIGRLPFDSLVVGGAMSRGGTTASSGAGRFITGLGDPNNKVIGNVGDIFQRLDGIPGATLYVKETGNSTDTDWLAIGQRQRTIMWVNHFDLLPGDSSVTTSFNAVSSGVGSGLTGLVIQSSTTGENAEGGGNKVVHMGLQVPPNYSIRGVRVCYELSNKRSFISQIRLAQVQTPPQSAIVRLDDGTNQTNRGPICIDSAETTVDPTLGEVLLSLRVNFGKTSDKIVVRALGLHLSPM
jgi:hypothetical protein